MVSGLFQDLKHSTRMLLKNPGFTCVAIASIAIGVGANAAMFSMADALVLRPLPVPRPSEVMTVAGVPPVQGLRNPMMSYRDYVDVREGTRSFERLAAYQLLAVGFATAQDELAQRRVGVASSENLLDASGLAPLLGRWFRADENAVVGRSPVVVLAYDTWTEQFGSDSNIIDRRVFLSGIDFTVIGVTPEGFSGLDPYVRPGFYVPVAMAPSLNTSAPADVLERRDARVLRVKGRLRPGATMTQARQDVASVAATLAKQYPGSNRGLEFTVQTELQSRTSHATRVSPVACRPGLGLAAAAAMNNLLRAAFPVSSGVSPRLFALVVPALLVVTLTATLIPARRASRIDPLIALRQE